VLLKNVRDPISATFSVCETGVLGGISRFKARARRKAEPATAEALAAVENAAGAVTLTWEAPDDSVTGYQILRRNPDAGEQSVSILVSDTGSVATSYTDMDVAAGTKYMYRVKAINEAGVGAKSSRVVITTSG
jgi:fibronectin type 3 domain-containing protein